jgi:16S rRNA C967 or C1407 C5-methylase (RsmB/RsmF family)/NOL1/NOP2/fmu family ribosome biogenesis protein
MATPPLPAAYVERMTALLGDEAEAFFASYDRPARPGLRVNTHKITPEDFQRRSPWPLEPVPWCPTGFYLPEDAPAGKHPWHAAGVYYLQEPSAMAVVEQLFFGLGMLVADVCAAPGGKSTQIQDHLADGNLLLSNEVIGSRVKALGENLERWGSRQSVIASQEVGRLAALQSEMYFQVLVDAPCSGEGLFRRSPEARAEWSVAHVEGSARRQRGLLASAAKLVPPGGNLVYSTCTFAPEENEQIIAGFLDAHPSWSLVPIDSIAGGAPGRSAWAVTTHDLSGMARLWPHQIEGDGHTIARLKRSGDDDGDLSVGPMTNPPYPTRSAERAMNEFLAAFAPGFEVTTFPVQQGDALFVVPMIDAFFGGLPMVRKGLWVGTVAPGRFTPSHALALAMNGSQCALVETLDFEEAARYLSGETLTKPGEPGWVLMTFDGFSLGWGKRSGDVIKNHYPKGLRRPVASWMSAAG